MKMAAAFLAAASMAVLAGCGSGGNMAPIVYGTQPSQSGQVYAAAQPYQAGAASRPAGPASAPVQLAPLTAVSAEPLAPAPVYVSAYQQSESAPYAYEPAIATSAPAAATLIVAPGDTVYAIARRTGASPSAIIAENALVAPYALKVGQTIRIPTAGQKIANIGAAASPNFAPAPIRVSEVPAAPADRIHVVRSGDTLYSISRSTGVSVPAIAQANNLRAPFTLKVGAQVLIPGSLRGTPPAQREARATPPAPAPRVEELARTVSYTPPPAGAQKQFEWPVKGAIIGQFGTGSLGRRNDGINIAAPVGTPVRAAADGEVVYRGSELDGYGNLLLIKHGSNYVTAYAHNDVMLVKKGDKVRQGEVIAKVGQTGAATEPQLHFEIRHNLKAVDPAEILGK